MYPQNNCEQRLLSACVYACISHHADITATGVGWSIVGILLAIIAVLLLFLFCKPLHKYVDKVTRN